MRYVSPILDVTQCHVLLELTINERIFGVHLQQSGSEKVLYSHVEFSDCAPELSNITVAKTSTDTLVSKIT